ncbi:hypothetical protein C8F01DRAFT_1232259 [Mycena amicta]|nr:hypothetical protein C8F01DRAFT_1232259 [Mycena amicta]
MQFSTGIDFPFQPLRISNSQDSKTAGWLNREEAVQPRMGVEKQNGHICSSTGHSSKTRHISSMPISVQGLVTARLKMLAEDIGIAATVTVTVTIALVAIQIDGV